jgi:outer membrane protein assembly factor BamD (BamD/ComL family)
MGLYYKLLHIPLFTGLVWEDEQSLSRRPKAFEENSQIRTKYNDIFNQHIEKVKNFYNVIINYIEQNKITHAIKVYQKLRSRFKYNVGLEQIDTLMANYIKQCMDQTPSVSK